MFPEHSCFDGCIVDIMGRNAANDISLLDTLASICLLPAARFVLAAWCPLLLPGADPVCPVGSEAMLQCRVKRGMDAAVGVSRATDQYHGHGLQAL